MIFEALIIEAGNVSLSISQDSPALELLTERLKSDSLAVSYYITSAMFYYYFSISLQMRIFTLMMWRQAVLFFYAV